MSVVGYVQQLLDPARAVQARSWRDYECEERLVLGAKELWWARMFRLSLSPVWIEERDELMKDYGKIICSI